VSVRQVRSMRYNWPGDHPDDHGGRKHKNVVAYTRCEEKCGCGEVLRLQSPLAKQRRDKGRLHAEPSIEQGVDRHEGQERRKLRHAAAHRSTWHRGGRTAYDASNQWSAIVSQSGPHRLWLSTFGCRGAAPFRLEKISQETDWNWPDEVRDDSVRFILL